MISSMKQVNDSTYLLESGKFVNSYALVGANGVLLIDTATPGKADAILKELAEINVHPADIKAIVITHAHPDHAGSCALLAEKTHARIYIHKNDRDVLLGKVPPPKPRTFFQKLPAFMSKHFFKYPPPGDAIPLDEDTGIEGFEDLKVIYTPGHTPGSMSILDEKDKTLFCGDALNNRGNRLTGPNKLFTIDTELAWHSIAKLGAVSFKTLCPGHGTWIADDAQQKVQDLLVAKRASKKSA